MTTYIMNFLNIFMENATGENLNKALTQGGIEASNINTLQTVCETILSDAVERMKTCMSTKDQIIDT